MDDMQQNLSQLFYVKNNVKNNLEERDSFVRELDRFEISKTTIRGEEYTKFFKFPGAGVSSFQLTTTYPGLLIGSGYSHPALHKVKPSDKNDLSDFQLGFFFDHTTGLPVIPGSSVKGVLKSVFPKKDFLFEKAKLDYIKDLAKREEITHKNWMDIFFKRENPNGKKLVFLDAYISKIVPQKNIFADDYITPHGKNIFKEPKPIRFLKIAPEVEFTFQFLLYPYKKDKVDISAHEIKEVFKQILLEFGIGAKRNVGYGHLK